MMPSAAMKDQSQAGTQQQYVDPHNPGQSCVVHVRNLSRQAQDADVLAALQHFGAIQAVMIMTGKGQALVEFADINGAIGLVNYAATNPVYICGQPAFYNYSTSQKIKRDVAFGGDASQGGAGGLGQDSKVLLFTILNCTYPITPDILYTVCSPHGRVLRVVIFRKNGVQAMVEFDNSSSARGAKNHLNGCDIYSGCCTLKIEFAKAQRLNVYKNDHETWDYENPPTGQIPGYDKKGAALLNPPPFPGSYGAPRGMPYGVPPGPDGGMPPPPPPGAWDPSQAAPWGYPAVFPGQQPFPGQAPPAAGGAGGYPPPPPGHAGMVGGGGGPRGGPQTVVNPQPNCVIMVYGLNQAKMNCDMVFNLFCLFGNIIRIKFLKSMEGSCMVQLGDQQAVERCMQYLDNLHFFGNTMQLGHSKQPFLQDVLEPYALPDGTPSFKDYTNSRNNRFTNPHQAAKNRVMPPSRVLRFFNAPLEVSDETIRKVFTDAGAPPPLKISRFSARSRNTALGQCEYSSVPEGVEAMSIANHRTIADENGRNPHTFRLCFFIEGNTMGGGAGSPNALGAPTGATAAGVLVANSGGGAGAGGGAVPAAAGGGGGGAGQVPPAVAAAPLV